MPGETKVSIDHDLDHRSPPLPPTQRATPTLNSGLPAVPLPRRPPDDDRSPPPHGCGSVARPFARRQSLGVRVRGRGPLDCPPARLAWPCLLFMDDPGMPWPIEAGNASGRGLSGRFLSGASIVIQTTVGKVVGDASILGIRGMGQTYIGPVPSMFRFELFQVFNLPLHLPMSSVSCLKPATRPSMPVYCSNFYSFLQCRNFAPQFGERCGFCTVHKRGRPMKEGLLPRRSTMRSPGLSSTTEEDDDSDDSWTNVDDSEDGSPRRRARRGAHSGSA